MRSLPLEGGESAPVTSFPLDIDSFKVFTGSCGAVVAQCLSILSILMDD